MRCRNVSFLDAEETEEMSGQGNHFAKSWKGSRPPGPHLVDRRRGHAVDGGNGIAAVLGALEEVLEGRASHDTGLDLYIAEQDRFSASTGSPVLLWRPSIGTGTIRTPIPEVLAEHLGTRAPGVRKLVKMSL